MQDASLAWITGLHCAMNVLIRDREKAVESSHAHTAAGRWRRLWWSLAGRIWLTSLLLVALMGALGVSIAARLAILERSVNQVLSRNYRSIQAANGMLEALGTVHGGDQNPAQARADFYRMLSVARHNVTEPGEKEIIETIARQADNSLPRSGPRPGGAAGILAELIAINERAMFSADRHTVAVAQKFTGRGAGLFRWSRWCCWRRPAMRFPAPWSAGRWRI